MKKKGIRPRFCPLGTGITHIRNWRRISVHIQGVQTGA